jgi:hypothetical protein
MSSQIMCHAQQVLVDGLSMSYSMKHVCSDMRCFVILHVIFTSMTHLTPTTQVIG